MASTADQMRAWRGPALLTFGFRPFFLGAALWAALAMVLWLGMLAGHVTLPTRFDPISWHAHEFLFGYLGAVMAGFLLTAVPNWTGRLPVVGWPLTVLVLLWLAGRGAVMVSGLLGPIPTAAIDLAFPVVLAGVIAREIVRGRNWRNLAVLALFAVFVAGNAVFHAEAAADRFAAQGFGMRIGIAGAVLMIAFIGGRIVPSFTRNWLVRREAGRLPAPPMRGYDKLALAGLALALVAWIAAPESVPAGVLLLAAGGLHALRLVRWSGDRTGAEPLVWVLHAAYAFVALGALALGVAALWPDGLAPAAALHLWMAGAIGLMTLAVMTRATLGHTGQALTAGAGTTLVYGLMIAAALVRLAAGLVPEAASDLYLASGLLWIGAFAGFALLYGPLLLRERQG
ncbi:MAG: NnrS family protein [Alphaproteobacteria bacterium]|nr:NnrS family protein [Alphaproteobacteria bacterium]MCB9928706.1 NnrS family protein [Alphaproteobacteria bacterium]